MDMEKKMEQEKYKFGVRYYTRGGHMKQLADAIAEEVGCEAILTSERIRGYTDTLFLGGALYANKIDESIKGFITRLHRQNVGKIILFGSAAIGDPCKKIRKELENRGFLAETDYFLCKGSFKFIAKGHPDADDIENARAFARRWLEEPK